MLEQALLCFNLQKLPLVSQRSIFTHKINTTSSLGYYPLSTEITLLSFNLPTGARRSIAARPALSAAAPRFLGRREGGLTTEIQQARPEPARMERGELGDPGQPVHTGPGCAAPSPGRQPAPSLRSDGWREVRVGLGLCFVGFHLLIPFPSALLDCNSHLGSGSAGPAPSDLPLRGWTADGTGKGEGALFIHNNLSLSRSSAQKIPKQFALNKAGIASLVFPLSSRLSIIIILL